jgi:hypothetical protein
MSSHHPSISPTAYRSGRSVGTVHFGAYRPLFELLNRNT